MMEEDPDREAYYEMGEHRNVPVCLIFTISTKQKNVAACMMFPKQ